MSSNALSNCLAPHGSSLMVPALYYSFSQHLLMVLNLTYLQTAVKVLPGDFPAISTALLQYFHSRLISLPRPVSLPLPCVLTFWLYVERLIRGFLCSREKAVFLLHNPTCRNSRIDSSIGILCNHTKIDSFSYLRTQFHVPGSCISAIRAFRPGSISL